eukprot:6187580-Pleurochrysis_carterae.AAC.1
MGLHDQVCRETGELLVLHDILGPPSRHRVYPLRRVPTAQARRVRHRERAARWRGKHRRVSTLPDLLQQSRRHVVPEHVVVATAQRYVDLHRLDPPLAQRARQRRVRLPGAREHDQDTPRVVAPPAPPPSPPGSCPRLVPTSGGGATSPSAPLWPSPAGAPHM